MKSSSAFSPASISCIFAPYDGGTNARSGSLGLGIALDRGATAKVAPSPRLTIMVNGEEWRLPTVRRLVSSMTDEPLKINLTLDLPVSCGFGMSAGATLASALAINERLELGKTRSELAELAHSAEILEYTGRGDVASQLSGGVSWRLTKGQPLLTKRINIKPRRLYYRVFGPISTSSILRDVERQKKIVRAGTQALQRLMNAPKKNLDLILNSSLDFAFDSALLTERRLIKVIDEIKEAGGCGSMIMLGRSIIATIPFTGSSEISISNRGAMVL